MLPIHLPPRSTRDLSVALIVSVLVAAVMVFATSRDFPMLHAVLDTSAFLISGVLALVLRDLGWRTGRRLLRRMAVAFGIVAVFELIHVLTSLGMTAESTELRRFAEPLYPGTWPPAAYLLPLALGAALWIKPPRFKSSAAFALALLVAGASLLALFQWLPPYTRPPWLAITRLPVVLVPLLWVVVGAAYWRQRREEDGVAYLVALLAVLAIPTHFAMLFSMAPADSAAMIAHAGKVVGEVFLLVSLTRMGTLEGARGVRAERELKLLNEALEERVADRTKELQTANAALRSEMGKTLIHLERMELLHKISRAIGERQDIASIFEVVVGSLEEHLPVDFACVGRCAPHDRRLTICAVGPKSAPLAGEIGLSLDTCIDIEDDGLGLCASRKLIHEPDLAALDFPFPQRLVRGGMRGVIVAPLLVEHTSGLFGVLVVARRDPGGFTTSDCEFLRLLSEHVALATNHAKLYAELQLAYDDLHLTQQRVTQHERLRALGQMASGIAHDINNAISPITLYTEALLTHEPGLSPRARKQLETMQRAIDDVAQTVARMGEFYRRQESSVLLPVPVNKILEEVLDMTRARWSDMAQQRGIVIDARAEEAPGDPLIMAVESEIREALINLVLNAADAMPEGGTLTLRSRLQKDHGNSPANNPGEQRVILEVSDTGTGMDEPTRLRCFEPFFTTKGERGSGLGLAMVYGIAQRHGAVVDIVSTVGVGTTFGLAFPAAALVVGASMAGKPAVFLAEATRILLVDDEPRLLQALREVLEADGHDVETADGGQAGTDLFRAAKDRGAPFSVVITDLGMPHVDGHQVAAAIKASAPATTVLMLTGWGQRLAATGETPANVDRVLSKPPNLRELRELLTLRSEHAHPTRASRERRVGPQPATMT
jgi:signal transduction histidine kinase/ActR/RegA family two-component response regulator